MPSASSSVQRTSTGISGLDDVLLGGFLRGGFYLLQGDPGSGKTTLALQFVHGRLRERERCLYVSLTESRADLESACRSHGWSLDGLELSDLSRSSADLEAHSQVSVFHPADTELSDLVKVVREEVERVQPLHIVFDGMSELRLLAGEPLRYRRTLLSLKELFASKGVTALLLDDRSGAFGSTQPESLVSGNIILERVMPVYGKTRRRLAVTKVRGSDFLEGFHDYDIVTGGVIVYPRLVASEQRLPFDRELFSSGVKNLDAMLHGGLAAGSTTLMIGPAGAGKSTAAMQFVVSALRRGQKAAVYVFDEVRHTLVERVEKLCIQEPDGIQGFVEEGLLHIQQVDPAEKSPGAFAHLVRSAVADGTRVVVIDSLNGYLNSMPEERFLTTHLHELFAFLNHSGVLTIIVVAQHGMMASTAREGTFDVSYLADSVLLFRYYEAGGEVNQAVSVFKKRTGPHERSIRRLTIDESGFSVGEPLRQFHGIMTGVPQYDDADLTRAGSAPNERRPE